MGSESAVDEKTGRKFFLDYPDDLGAAEEVTFLLDLHGGGSGGPWQRRYFPAHDYVGAYRLVVATPTADTGSGPGRSWVPEADDEHLRTIVELVFRRFGPNNIRAFWLVGHSQGGMTSNRLLLTDYFAERVDGWLSLSGGRIGPAERSPGAGRPARPGEQPRARPTEAERARFANRPTPGADFSFIFAVGEHEIVGLPESSPWAERYGAGPRVRLPDVVDSEPGQTYDTTLEGHSTPAWGLAPRPGTAQVYVFPNAEGARLIADVVRLDKGHTEGLEPRITEELIKMIVSAPGGKAQALVNQSSRSV